MDLALRSDASFVLQSLDSSHLHANRNSSTACILARDSFRNQYVCNQLVSASRADDFCLNVGIQKLFGIKSNVNCNACLTPRSLDSILHICDWHFSSYFYRNLHHVTFGICSPSSSEHHYKQMVPSDWIRLSFRYNWSSNNRNSIRSGSDWYLLRKKLKRYHQQP